jgi:hypothetical protein
MEEQKLRIEEIIQAEIIEVYKESLELNKKYISTLEKLIQSQEQIISNLETQVVVLTESLWKR